MDGAMCGRRILVSGCSRTEVKGKGVGTPIHNYSRLMLPGASGNRKAMSPVGSALLSSTSINRGYVICIWMHKYSYTLHPTHALNV